MMRKKYLWLAVLMAVGITGNSFAAFSIEIKGDRGTAPEALFAGIVANFFGVDTKVVLDIRQQMNPVEVIGSLYLAGEENIYLHQAQADFKTGRGWAKLKKGGHIPPGLLKKPGHIPPGQLKKLGRYPTAVSSEQALFIRFMEDCYRIPQRTTLLWLSYGLSYDELALCVNLARRAKIQPESVVELRRAGRDWDWLCRRWKVSRQGLGSLSGPNRYRKRIKVRR